MKRWWILGRMFLKKTKHHLSVQMSISHQAGVSPLKAGELHIITLVGLSPHIIFFPWIRDLPKKIAGRAWSYFRTRNLERHGFRVHERRVCHCQPATCSRSLHWAPQLSGCVPPPGPYWKSAPANQMNSEVSGTISSAKNLPRWWRLHPPNHGHVLQTLPRYPSRHRKFLALSQRTRKYNTWEINNALFAVRPHWGLSN